MKIKLMIIALSLLGTNARAVDMGNRFTHPFRDYRDYGCNEGYYCAPVTSYMFGRFKIGRTRIKTPAPFQRLELPKLLEQRARKEHSQLKVAGFPFVSVLTP